MKGMAKWVYPLLCVLFFIVGAYVWKVFHTGSVGEGGRTSGLASLTNKLGGFGDGHQVLVTVGDQSITVADLTWEYLRHTEMLTETVGFEMGELGEGYEVSGGEVKKAKDSGSQVDQNHNRKNSSSGTTGEAGESAATAKKGSADKTPSLKLASQTSDQADESIAAVSGRGADRGGLSAHTEMAEVDLEPLRQTLLSQLVERKVLYEFIKSDTSFNREDPTRLHMCLDDWRNTLESSPKKFSKKEDQQRLKARLCEKSIIEQYASEKLFQGIKVSEEEIKEFYEANKVRLAEPEKVLIQQILLPDERTARKVRARLRGNNFEKLAKEFSIAPEAASGGQLGPFARGQLPDFFDVVFKMRRRQISDILKSPYGFHLIRLVNKYPARNPTLDEVREDIIKEITLARQDEEYRGWVERALAVVRVSAPKTLW